MEKGNDESLNLEELEKKCKSLLKEGKMRGIIKILLKVKSLKDGQDGQAKVRMIFDSVRENLTDEEAKEIREVVCLKPTEEELKADAREILEEIGEGLEILAALIELPGAKETLASKLNRILSFLKESWTNA